LESQLEKPLQSGVSSQFAYGNARNELKEKSRFSFWQFLQALPL
jgi:hypothetical protein